MSLLLSDFYAKADAVLVSGNQFITGVKTFSEGIVTPQVSAGGLGGTVRRIDLSLGKIYGGGSPSIDYFNRILSGNWQFQSRPTVGGTGVLLQGEASAGGEGDTNISDPFNGERPIKRIPSLSDPQPYGGTTVTGFLENMFFPYLEGSLTLNSVTKPNSVNYIYGIDSPIIGVFNGSHNQRDDIFNSFRFIRISGANTLSLTSFTPTLSNNFSIPNISLGGPITATTNNIFGVQASGTRKESSIIVTSSLGRMRFEPYYYWGLSNLSILTASNITGLLNTGYNTNYGINDKPSFITASFNNPVNQYLYFVYPNQNIPGDFIRSWGEVTSVADTNNLSYSNEFNSLPNLVNITFPNLKTLNYRVYRSNNIFNSPNELFTFTFFLT